jgi:hypothetical protein
MGENGERERKRTEKERKRTEREKEIEKKTQPQKKEGSGEALGKWSTSF